MSFLCVRCSTSEDEVSFDTVKELKEHESGGHRTKPKKELPPSPPLTLSATEKIKEEDLKATPEKLIMPESIAQELVKPLLLAYKWIGACPTCRTEVKTIEVELGEKNIIIGWCVHCDRKLKQQEVVPIVNKETPEEKERMEAQDKSKEVYPITKFRKKKKE